MAKSRNSHNTELDELKAKLREAEQKIGILEGIGKKFVDIQDRSDLCNDGKDLYDELKEVLELPVTVKRIVLSIELTDFELPPGSDPEDASNYEVSIKDRDGKVLLDNANPDFMEGYEAD